ncbi:MAG: response regulator [Chloroflexi bacterium]|nr:MAG: response regulator [Chloroflexota bacterium]
MGKRRLARRVLVVEDEADVRRFACRVLELEGYSVLEAVDGDEALRLAVEEQPSLVLLDLRLPKRDGWSVLEEMRRNPVLTSIPVIVFSASAGAPHRQRALGMGAVDYLVKPLSADDLRKAVGRVMHRRR